MVGLVEMERFDSNLTKKASLCKVEPTNLKYEDESFMVDEALCHRIHVDED